MESNGLGRRHRAPEQTRALLIDAAETEFAERGYAATSIHHICRGAGVSVGSFYHHFDDRTVLVAELLERAGERFADELAAVDIGRPKTIESVVAALVGGGYAAVYRSLRDAVEAEPGLADAAALIRAAVHDRLTATIRAARAHADAEYAVDAPSLAWTFLSLVRDALAGRGGPPARTIASVISYSAAARATTSR